MLTATKLKAILKWLLSDSAAQHRENVRIVNEDERFDRIIELYDTAIRRG